jgi:hypothetical protein
MFGKCMGNMVIFLPHDNDESSSTIIDARYLFMLDYYMQCLASHLAVVSYYQ